MTAVASQWEHSDSSVEGGTSGDHVVQPIAQGRGVDACREVQQFAQDCVQ